MVDNTVVKKINAHIRQYCAIAEVGGINRSNRNTEMMRGYKRL